VWAALAFACPAFPNPLAFACAPVVRAWVVLFLVQSQAGVHVLSTNQRL
jgi:hypothetical protein